VVNIEKPAANNFIVVVVYKKVVDPTVLPDFYIISSDKIAGLLESYNVQLRLKRKTR